MLRKGRKLIDFVKLEKSFSKSIRSFIKNGPIFLGVILLVVLIIRYIPLSEYSDFFSVHEGLKEYRVVIDMLVGAISGSIIAGNPINSYVLGGEFLKHGVSLIAVTTFLVSWVTVGIVQLPAESAILGKKFAIVRNVVSFLSSFVVAFVVVLIVSYLSGMGINF